MSTACPLLDPQAIAPLHADAAEQGQLLAAGGQRPLHLRIERTSARNRPYSKSKKQHCASVKPVKQELDKAMKTANDVDNRHVARNGLSSQLAKMHTSDAPCGDCTSVSEMSIREGSKKKPRYLADLGVLESFYNNFECQYIPKDTLGFIVVTWKAQHQAVSRKLVLQINEHPNGSQKRRFQNYAGVGSGKHGFR